MGILDKVKKAASSGEEYLKIFIWGSNGSGKSTLCGTAPKPILYAYTERQGLLSFQRMAPDADVVKIESVGDLRELLVALRDTQHGYASVCLDSFTEMQLLVADELLVRRKVKNQEKGKDEGEVPKLVMEDYMFIHDRSKSLVRAFRDLPMHVILTALSEQSEVGEGAEARTVTKMMLLGKKLPAQLGQFFNLVGFSYRAVSRENDAAYRVLFEGRPDLDTKGMPGLRKREEPDINYWVERAINGCPPRDKDAPMIAMPQQIVTDNPPKSGGKKEKK